MLERLAKGMKDVGLAIALKAFLNDRLRDFGEVLDCEIDTGRSRISVRTLLKGERDPLTVSVERYELAMEGEQLYATLRSFSSSRPWVSLLLSKVMTGKRYKLPGAVARLL